MDRRDATSVAACAHALKGSVGLFVQKGAYEIARRIERAAKNDHLDELGPLSVELETEMAALALMLKDLRSQLQAG